MKGTKDTTTLLTLLCVITRHGNLYLRCSLTRVLTFRLEVVLHQCWHSITLTYVLALWLASVPAFYLACFLILMFYQACLLT